MGCCQDKDFPNSDDPPKEVMSDEGKEAGYPGVGQGN